MSHYKPYPEYKESSVEWIGEVPEHWELSRLKFLISKCQNGVWGDDPLENGTDTLCIRVADFDRQNLRVVESPPTYRQISEEHQRDRLVSKGDILLEKSGGGEKTPVGANVQYLGDKSSVCSNFVAVIKPSEKSDPKWLNFLMAAMYDIKINLKSIKQSTGIQNLDSEQYLSEAITHPSVEEQKTIAEVIDHETTRIDTLITKKTRFIELLKEKRQALITHAVTKGLNPKVKMKDSGVEWIGEVPEHWAVQPIKYLVRIGNGSTPNKSEGAFWEDGNFPWLTSGCVNQDYVTNALEYVTDKALQDCHLPIIKPPAVLVGITGQGKTRGMATTLKIEATINQHIAYLKPKSPLLEINFLRSFLDASYDWLRFDSEGAGSTKGAITCEQLANTKIPFPPETEQKNIIDHLDHQMERLSRLLHHTECSIKLLKERRSAFITAAVTGQIDLRGKQI